MLYNLKNTGNYEIQQNRMGGLRIPQVGSRDIYRGV